MKSTRWIQGGALLVLLHSVMALGQSAGPAYRVIVNPANPSTTLERAFVADAFLKKTTRWNHGETIRPVDLAGDPYARRRFSEEVLDRSVAAVKSYWQQLIFSGRDVPPPEVDSDADAVKYVLKYPGGIGYVSGTANLNGARVVSIR